MRYIQIKITIQHICHYRTEKIKQNEVIDSKFVPLCMYFVSVKQLKIKIFLPLKRFGNIHFSSQLAPFIFILKNL